MSIDFHPYGLEYTSDLCTAIEQYTATKVRDDPQAFKYRGMQLKYAVERWLYIRCINSEALFCHYANQRHGACGHSGLHPLEGIEADIAFFLTGTRPLLKWSVKRRIRWLMSVFLRIYSWLKPRGQQTREVQTAVKRSGVVIQVVNLKFARYLEPITRKMEDGSYSFLSIGNTQLTKELIKNGYPVTACSKKRGACQAAFSYFLLDFAHLVRNADILLETLRDIQPSCVVVVEGNAPDDSIAAEASRLLGIPCYCVQHGWSPYVHNGFRNLNFTEMFVWGPKFAELLSPYSPNQLFRVTGAHAIQGNLSQMVRERVEVLSFFLQAPCALLGLEAYNAFVGLIIEVSKSHPDIYIIVRNHPSHPLPDEFNQKLGTCANVHFSTPATESVAEVIAVSDLAVSIFSTVILEAMAMGVVPLICSISAIEKYEPDIVSSGAAIEVHSIAEAKRTIDAIIAEPARLEKIKDCVRVTSGTFFNKKDGAESIVKRLLSSSAR